MIYRDCPQLAIIPQDGVELQQFAHCLVLFVFSPLAELPVWQLSEEGWLYFPLGELLPLFVCTDGMWKHTQNSRW